MNWNKAKIRRLSKGALIGLGVTLLLAQFIPVDRTNPPVEAQVDAPPEVVAVLQRACYDCHSNETVWPPYSRIAPLSWFVANHVYEGRDAVNYTTWGRYSAEERAELVEETWEELEEGEMPPPMYVRLNPDAQVSNTDRALVRAWAAGSEGAARAEEEEEESEH